MSDDLIYLIVVGSRFLVPLLIPRFPLPAVLAALVIDAADQTIFEQFTDINLDGYQGYDKALDIYYLTIAFTSTTRNWSSSFAFQVARFLFYYRLIGVTAFELTDQRWMLLVFANTFEYFFIFYEGVRTSWNPARLGRRGVVGAAAAIWIFIKLPQEWWIHIAQLDFTDFMKEDVFGVTPTSSWGDALTNRLGVTFLLVAAIGVIAFVGQRQIRRLPAHDWPFTVDADVQNQKMGWTALPGPGEWSEPVRGWATFEKVGLITLVAVIFSQMLPNSNPTGLQIVIGVALLVVVDAAIAIWRSTRELEWRSTLTRFVALSAVNLSLLAFFSWVVGRGDQEVEMESGLFFAMLISLIIVLFDRYRRLRSARLAAQGRPDDADPSVGLTSVAVG